MNKFKTSIIIPHLNTLDYLVDCIESIKKYTKDYEIIVVDNGSTKDLEEIKNYLFLNVNKTIYNQTNNGFSKANNQGAEIAEGEYLCFMNSDIIVGRNWLKELFETMKNKNCGAVGPLGNPAIRELNGVVISYQQYIGQYKEDTKVNNLIGYCFLIKKSTFEEVGKWDEDFLIGNFEDNYLSYKIIKKGYDLWISVNSEVKHLNPGRTFDANNIDYVKSFEINKVLYNKKVEALKT